MSWGSVPPEYFMSKRSAPSALTVAAIFFATHPEVPAEIFPEDCGFIRSDGYGAEILREAPEHRLPAPTRKALTLRMARAGAARLMAAEMAGIEIMPVEGESE